jgi:hypothetical protein
VEGNYYLRGFNYLFLLRKPEEGSPEGDDAEGPDDGPEGFDDE